MDRRTFLQQMGLSLGALGTAATASGQEKESNPPRESKPLPPKAPRAFDATNWASVREQFPLTRDYIHMATFLLASHPRPVAEAIETFRRALDDNPADCWHEHFFHTDEKVRAAAAEYMGGDSAHIALTDSTTMGLGLIYGAMHLEPGDEIVTTTHDHYATHMSLTHRADRTGAAVRYVSLYETPATVSVDEIVSRMRAAISDRTRVLAVTWVHSSTGVKLPLAAMSAALREINASRDPKHRVLFCVDGVHGFGIENVTIDELGCDFFMAGTHKWIFGPRGTGVIWGRPEAWKCARPVIPSFGPNYEVWIGGMTVDQVPVGDLMTPGGFHSFEHRWALGEAFRFHKAIGKPRVQARIHTLNTQAKDALAAMPHVTLHTPRSPALSSGIICFEVDGHGPEAVVEKLREHRVISSTSPYRVSYPRIAPSLINNEDEVDRTVQAIRSLA